MTQVSFIIPSYNSWISIKISIQSLMAQKLSELIDEIIVVDSSDDTKTREILKTFESPKLKLILLDQKTSPALGRNIGAKEAKGELLCFVDSDVYLAEDWLEEVVKSYAEGCKIGCGSVSVPPFQEKKMLPLAQLYLQFNESLNTGSRRQVEMVPACNMFVDRAVFEAAGGFPNIRASEDVLLCLTIGKQHPVWFVPEAECFHIFREDLGAYYRNQMVLGEYIIVYRRMTYNKWFYKGLWPLALLPVFLLIKSTRIKFRIMKAGPIHFGRYLKSVPLFIAGLYYWGAGFAQGCFKNKD